MDRSARFKPKSFETVKSKFLSLVDEMQLCGEDENRMKSANDCLRKKTPSYKQRKYATFLRRVAKTTAPQCHSACKHLGQVAISGMKNGELDRFVSWLKETYPAESGDVQQFNSAATLNEPGNNAGSHNSSENQQLCNVRPINGSNSNAVDSGVGLPDMPDVRQLAYNALRNASVVAYPAYIIPELVKKTDRWLGFARQDALYARQGGPTSCYHSEMIGTEKSAFRIQLSDAVADKIREGTEHITEGIKILGYAF